MSTDEKLERLTQIASVSLDSIAALERIASTHTDQIDKLAQQVAALGQQVAVLSRDWQAYLRPSTRGSSQN